MTSAFCAVEGSAEAAGSEFKKTKRESRADMAGSGEQRCPFVGFLYTFRLSGNIIINNCYCL